MPFRSNFSEVPAIFVQRDIDRLKAVVELPCVYRHKTCHRQNGACHATLTSTFCSLRETQANTKINQWIPDPRSFADAH